MKKTTALLTVNAIVLSIIAINTYKPEITKLANKYTKIKKLQKSSSYHKLEKKKIIEETIKIVGNPQKLVEEALTTTDLTIVETTNLLPLPIHDYLYQKMESVSYELALIPSTELALVPVSKNIYGERSLNEILTCPYIEIETIKTHIPSNKTLSNYIKYLFGMISILLVLNNADKLDNLNTLITKESIESATQEIDEFVTDSIDTIVTLNNHEKLVERKVSRIANSEQTYEEKLISIFNLEELTFEEKTQEIINIKNIPYSVKFDFFIKSNNYSKEEALKIIISSNLTTSENIFNYIMGINSLSMDEKVNYIMTSDLTLYTRVFDYLLNDSQIANAKAHEYIVNSNIATYEEKLNYYIKSNISSYDKIWNILQIPNIEFKTVFNDLINSKAIPEAEIIENVMKTDLISFKTLFDNIIEIDGITKERLSEYLTYYNNYYNSGFNTISLKDLIDYTLEIPTFDHETKVNTFWALLENLTLNERSEFILEYYNIDYENDYINLVTSFKDNFTEEEMIILELFSKIDKLKDEFIFAHYNITDNEFKITASGCAAEGAKDYQDLYWVANTFFNRITHPWYTKKGINPYLQFIEDNQFSVYASKDYLSYLYPQTKSEKAQYIRAEIALRNMLYDGYSGIEHDYVEFRSSNITDFSNNMIVPNGNRYGKILIKENRIKIDGLNGIDEYFG